MAKCKSAKVLKGKGRSRLRASRSDGDLLLEVSPSKAPTAGHAAFDKTARLKAEALFHRLAKTVAGAARNATHVFLSYSAGADWTSREWAAPLDAVEETLVPVAPSVAERLTPCARDDASPDCAVLWAAAASCRGGAQF